MGLSKYFGQFDTGSGDTGERKGKSRGMEGGRGEEEEGRRHVWRLIYTTQVSLEGAGSVGNWLGGCEQAPGTGNWDDLSYR